MLARASVGGFWAEEERVEAASAEEYMVSRASLGWQARPKNEPNSATARKPAQGLVDYQSIEPEGGNACDATIG